MALTPLEVEVLNPDGSPAASATVELRHELTGLAADGYNRDGSVMTPPILTDSAGAAMTWLPNGIYEWRSVGTVTTGWRAFRAYAGYGAESGPLTSSPATSLDDPLPASFTTLDTLVIPSFGVDDVVGSIRLTVNFAFDHVNDLALQLQSPGATREVAFWDGAGNTLGDYAFDGEVMIQATGLDHDYDEHLTDGHTYGMGAAWDTFRDADASGTWTLRWQDTGLAASPTHTGILRSWAIEFIPA